MTIGRAQEGAADGIGGNAVRPGLVDTAVHARGGQPDRLDRMAPLMPMGGGGQAP
jgi:hypothetical protein